MHLVFLLSCLLACGETQPATSPTPPEQEAPPDPPAPTLDASQVARVLAPSPLALEAELRAAGVADSLASLVPPERFSRETTDKDVIAIRTGVRVADAVLAGRTDDKATFLTRIKSIRDGMAAIGLGAGRLSDLDDFVKKVENDAASREDFVTELDQVSSEAVLGEGWGPTDKTGPLVQAGAWLGATDLVARAVVQKGDPAAATALLRRAEVAEYFLQYTRQDAADKAPAPVLAALEAALNELARIARKEQVSIEDAKAVSAATGELFAYL